MTLFRDSFGWHAYFLHLLLSENLYRFNMMHMNVKQIFYYRNIDRTNENGSIEQSDHSKKGLTKPMKTLTLLSLTSF
jgi:hypothetical protein